MISRSTDLKNMHTERLLNLRKRGFSFLKKYILSLSLPPPLFLARVCLSVCVYREQLEEVGSFLLLCEFWGLNSSCSWIKAPLTTDLSYGPDGTFIPPMSTAEGAGMWVVYALSQVIRTMLFWTEDFSQIRGMPTFSNM